MTPRTLLAVALLLYLPQAFAYLDPGTASMIVQGLVGALAAAAAAVGLYWSRLKGLFASRGPKQADPGVTEPTPTSDGPPPPADDSPR